VRTAPTFCNKKNPGFRMIFDGLKKEFKPGVGSGIWLIQIGLSQLIEYALDMNRNLIQQFQAQLVHILKVPIERRWYQSDCIRNFTQTDRAESAALTAECQCRIE